MNRLGPAAAVLALLTGCMTAAGIATATPAFASTGGYPYYNMQCVWSPYASTGTGYWCTGYAWGTVRNDSGNDSVLSPYGYDYRNCTDFVAWKVASLGVTPAHYRGLGNAKNWAANAPGDGLTVNSTPAVGAAAVNTSGTFGHVAYISAYNSSTGQITVQEYNHGQDGNYDTRTGTLSGLGFSKVVHFEAYESGGSSSNIIVVKKTIANDGTQQVYFATTSDVYEAWWNSTSNGVHRDQLISIGQNNIVGIDKITQPDGTQSLYTAVPDGVWETYWNAGSGGPHSAKIISGLSGVTSVIATSEIDSGNYTHVLYVLTKNGPYQFWWQDGGNGIHSVQLAQISSPVAFAADQTPDGVDQVYTATAGAVQETWWRPGGPITTDPIIGISQNNITSVDKFIAPDGTEELYTGTTAGVWQSEWGGHVGGLTTSYVVNNLGAVAVKKRMDTGGTDQLYVANGSKVQQYWWNSGGGGGATLINISQGNISAIDEDTFDGIGQLYTAAGPWVYETWWNASGIHTDALTNAYP